MSLADLVKRRDSHRSVSLISRIDEVLSARTWEYRPGYHPSSVSYRFCPREEALIQLKYLTPVKNLNARMQRVFDNGHRVHARYQELTRGMGIVVEHPVFKGGAQEGRIKHPVGISGRVDDILSLEDGWWDVVDYKSINPDAFSTLIQPLAHHEKQVTIYLGVLEHMFDGSPPARLRGRLVYESKGDQALREFVVPWDHEHQLLFDRLVFTLGQVNDAVAAGNPLAVECTCGKCEAYDLDALRVKPVVVRT